MEKRNPRCGDSTGFEIPSAELQKPNKNHPETQRAAEVMRRMNVAWLAAHTVRAEIVAAAALAAGGAA
jgi:hypothetical protein